MVTLDDLVGRFKDRTARIGVIGLGYVGLPLAIEFAAKGYRTTGFDLNKSIVAALKAGTSHIKDVPNEAVRDAVDSGRLTASQDLDGLAVCDVVVICVPTPLNKMKDPDLSYVLTATWSIRETLRPGQLIVLESTTFPGTTREVVLPVLEESGLAVGRDIFVCFSPERVDPGNETWRTGNTPKVIGGATPACLEAGMALYGTVFERIVPVSTLEAAELTKVYENTFRLINIALANELAQECEKLGIDVWEVIDAAATKPFGFMRFTPGPGIGGHCIPLDPHYLSWKMRTLSYKTRMIEVASEINSEMPGFVVQRVADALNDEAKAVRGSTVLILGVAYKRDVGDMRESTAFEIMHQLQAKGAHLLYHDALCPLIDANSSLPLDGLPMQSVELSDEVLSTADAVVIVTDHSGVDYGRLADRARLIIDTRGVMRRFAGSARVVGLSGKEQSLHRSPARALTE
jgi:UDP-N-acetyl-D-glucosamine dehydrogenase